MDAPGALHNVMIRGIERTRISGDNQDRDKGVPPLADTELGLRLSAQIDVLTSFVKML